MVILSYNIPCKVLLAVGGSALLLTATIFFLSVKSVIRKKRHDSVGISNDNFKPHLPMSNIIKDKIRDTVPQAGFYESKRNKPILRLIELSSGTVYRIRLKKMMSAGRGRKNKIRIKDPSVAAIHCFFSFDGCQVYVEDNNTLNGTILNGILIKDKTPVFTNDLILIGNKEYKAEVLFL